MKLQLIFHFLWTDLHVTYAYNDLPAGTLCIVLELKTIKQIIRVCYFRLTTFKKKKPSKNLHFSVATHLSATSYFTGPITCSVIVSGLSAHCLFHCFCSAITRTCYKRYEPPHIFGAWQNMFLYFGIMSDW